MTTRQMRTGGRRRTGKARGRRAAEAADKPVPANTEPVPTGGAPQAVADLAETLDEIAHATIARMSLGLSPVALLGAYLDWTSHLGFAPGRRFLLAEEVARDLGELQAYAWRSATSGAGGEKCIEPEPQDRRFLHTGWEGWPFNIIQQAFLLQQKWWQQATGGVKGVTAQHEEVVGFVARQILDTVAPSNFIATNPEVLERTLATGGQNLVAGLANFAEDWQRAMNDGRPAGAEDFRVGETIAVTPGKVVFRNRLIELIQYQPTTPKVVPEPLLIVPAWIMKYYILDLSPGNSLVRYLVGQGFTVFVISWKNPDHSDRDLGLEDYRELGIAAALDAVGSIVPGRNAHMLGYCLGGTMAAIAAAAMARDSDDRLATLGMLAAQTDFTEAGELTLFINDSQLHFLDGIMRRQGFLDEKQMAWAFQMLRSNDLIWSRIVRDYLMGERRPMTDLMAWNADSTRLPYCMHSEYLRSLFLNNDISEGRYRVGNRPIALSDIRVPIFAVGTLRDHVSPWRSVFKIHLPADTEITFLLTSGGHNAGIVSEPGHRGRSYQVATRRPDDPYIDPDTWLGETPRQAGSWWPVYADWVKARSGAPVAPPRMGGNGDFRVREDAPGTYVFMS